MQAKQTLVHYQQVGDASARHSLILLHGLFGQSDNLMPLAKSLADTYCVYVVDLRNHGRSFHCETMGWLQMADDILALMDHLGLDKSGVLGHSLGGKVAMSLAGAYPQRVSALVIADIAPVEYLPLHQTVLAGLQAVELLTLGSRKQADEQLAFSVSDSSVRQFLLKNLYKNSEEAYSWRFNLPALLDNYDLLRSAPKMKAAYTGATLFIKGERSEYITEQYLAAIKATFPNFQFKMIQGAGHWLHAEKPVAFNRLVNRFFDSQL